MSLGVTVNDIDKSLYYLSGSLSISWRLKERGACSLSFRSRQWEHGVDDWKPALGDQVAIFDSDGVRRFVGDILTMRSVAPAGARWESGARNPWATPLHHHVTLSTLEWRFERRRLVQKVWASGEGAAVYASDVVQYVADLIGIETDLDAQSGASIEKYIVGARGAEDCWSIVQHMAEISDFQAWIDAENVLHFRAAGTTDAPWNIDVEAANFRDMEVTRSLRDKRNRQYYRIAWDAFDPLVATFEGDGSATEFDLYYIAAGEEQEAEPIRIESMTLTIGQETYEQRFGIKDVDTNDVEWYWSPGMATITQHEDGEVLQSGQVLEVRFRKLGDDSLVIEDAADQALNGIYAHAAEDLDCKAEADGETAATEMLEANTDPSTEISYQTDVAGLQPGMLQQIILPDFDLDGQYLITDVELKEHPITVDGQPRSLLRYDIKLTGHGGEGEANAGAGESWQEYFSKGKGGEQDRDTQEVTDGGISDDPFDTCHFGFGFCDPVTGDDVAYHGNVLSSGKPYYAVANSKTGTACKLDIQFSADGASWASILDGNQIEIAASDVGPVERTNFNTLSLTAPGLLRVDVTEGSAEWCVVSVRWKRIVGKAGSTDTSEGDSPILPIG